MLKKLRLFLFGLIFVGLGLNSDLMARKVSFSSADIMASIETQFPQIEDYLYETAWRDAILTYRGLASDLKISVPLELSQDFNGFNAFCTFLTNSVYARLSSSEFTKSYVFGKFVESTRSSRSIVDYCRTMINGAEKGCVSSQDQRNLILAKATLLNLLFALLDCAMIQNEVAAKVGWTKFGRFDYQKGPGQIFSGIRGRELSVQIPVVPRIGKSSRKYLYNCGMISRFFVNREVEEGEAESSDYFIFDDNQTNQYMLAIVEFVRRIPPVASLPSALPSSSTVVSPSFSRAISPSLASRPSSTRRPSLIVQERSVSRERSISPRRQSSPVRPPSPSVGLRSERSVSPALSRASSFSFEFIDNPEVAQRVVTSRVGNVGPHPWKRPLGSLRPRTVYQPQSSAIGVSSSSSSPSSFSSSFSSSSVVPPVYPRALPKRPKGKGFLPLDPKAQLRERARNFEQAEEAEQAARLGLPLSVFRSLKQSGDFGPQVSRPRSPLPSRQVSPP